MKLPKYLSIILSLLLHQVAYADPCPDGTRWVARVGAGHGSEYSKLAKNYLVCDLGRNIPLHALTKYSGKVAPPAHCQTSQPQESLSAGSKKYSVQLRCDGDALPAFTEASIVINKSGARDIRPAVIEIGEVGSSERWAILEVQCLKESEITAIRRFHEPNLCW